MSKDEKKFFSHLRDLKGGVMMSFGWIGFSSRDRALPIGPAKPAKLQATCLQLSNRCLTCIYHPNRETSGLYPLEDYGF
jgi:hypothetical protein